MKRFSLVVKWQITYANESEISFSPCWKPSFTAKFRSYSEIMTSWGSRDCHRGSLFSRCLSHFAKIENACFWAQHVLSIHPAEVQEHMEQTSHFLTSSFSWGLEINLIPRHRGVDKNNSWMLMWNVCEILLSKILAIPSIIYFLSIKKT